MKYTQLTLDDRINIYIFLQQQISITKIAEKLKRDKSTISREISRNSGLRGYRYKQAHTFSLVRKMNSKKNVRLTISLQRLIERKLKIKWSPEQISNWMRVNNFGSISHETIYKMIAFDKELGGTLHAFLRQSNRKRRKVYSSGKIKKGSIKNRISITERPEVVNQQARIGDFEGDTIVGKNHQGSIVSLVDRKSLYLKMEILPDRTSDSVSSAISKILDPLKERVHTITFDNGKEFASHENIAEALDVKIFFADPYSFWQRGINENMNGLIRQYFPKKTDFSKITRKEIARIEHEINNRPRKKLGYKTPHQVFWSNSPNVAVAT